MLARLHRPDLPEALGVLHAVQRAPYEELLEAQVKEAVARKGKGDLHALLRSGDTWQRAGLVPVERHFTGSAFEEAVGFARAVKVGDRILVAGTVGIEGRRHLGRACTARWSPPCGGSCGPSRRSAARRADIVRTRIYAVDPVGAYEDVARAHKAVFAEHPPVTALLGVSGLVQDVFLIEIEAEAVVGAGDA